ncbi:hypothetical protein L1049_024603 [Liquidambar formosana]|uniref:Transcriptional regulator STERILE APETALA n=1 Tax=Liquidambar formosana TaxID=63359 RepID=A0AAP0RUF0_LIQFO
MSSSSSSSSSSSEGDGNGGGGGGGDGVRGVRHRFGNGVWPEPFVEALASQVAIDASRSHGRLAAAPALANLFLVCSTWRAVSRSDLLWHRLNRRIWNRTRCLHATWHEEYVFRHRTAFNFVTGQSSYTTLLFDPTDAGDNNDSLSCRCLALSDLYLACGFADGTIRLFELLTRLHTATFHPVPRDDRLGRFSAAVSGIIIDNEVRLVFATFDGDINVAAINNNAPTYRAHLGNVVNDGILVDFAGCSRWWVGLYAGVPGRSFRIWDGVTEGLLFVGGSLTDREAVVGWHLLNELTEFVGRVRVTSLESAVACTASRIMVFDLRNQVPRQEVFRRGVVVGSVDTSNEAYVFVNNSGVASVRRADTLEEVCRFVVGGGSAQRRGLLGCMNDGYALMCARGVITVWEVSHGERLYSFGQSIGVANALIADERHVAACCSDTSIHLWDFGAQ